LGTREGKRSNGKPRHRWEDNIKVYIHKELWGMYWVDLALNTNRWHALVNAVMKLRVP
jgi:hypothetical protein